MRNLTSLDRFELQKRGTVFIVESPIASLRHFKLYRDALGEVSIDGVKREPIGFEWHAVGSPVHIGERIGILVRTEEE